MIKTSRFRALGGTGARFVMLHLGLTIIATLVVFSFIYRAADRLVLTDLRMLVQERVAILDAEYAMGGVDHLARIIEQRTKDVASADFLFLLVDHDGHRIAGNLAFWPPTVRDDGKWSEIMVYRIDGKLPEHVGVTAVRLKSGQRLLVGKVMRERRQLQESLALALVGGLLLALPLSFLGSAVLLRFIKAHVRAIGRVAARVEAGDFGTRVPVRGINDPFDELAFALNRMFERLQRLVEELRIVTDSLAHDLRSPLTRMTVAVERARASMPADSDCDPLAPVNAEIDRMLKMLATTLEVSRAEAGLGRESFALFDATELGRDLCEMYQPLAEDRGVIISLEADAQAPMLGNRELLAQAVANLVDNALKYGASAGEIILGVTSKSGHLCFTVADRGPGISDQDRATALMRYRRLDSARTHDGAGLGLALVEAVARLHGGEVRLEDNQPGLRAVIDVPLLAAA